MFSTYWHSAGKLQNGRPIVPATIIFPRGETSPLGESAVAGGWSPLLKLPGRIPTCGDLNTTELMLTQDYML